MADNFRYAQLQPYALAGAGAVIGATSITLQSMKDIDGNSLSMASDFGTMGFGTLDPGNGTLEEQISFTGLTNNANGTTTLTGISSVVFVYPYTKTSGLSKTHAGATPFVISNTSGFYDSLTAKDNDETITGTWTFPSGDSTHPGIASDTDTTIATKLVTLGQMSRQAISGAANASTSVKGIIQIPTQAEVDSKTATGSTGALLVPPTTALRSTLLSDYVADTGAADAYVITPSPAISAYATGQRFTFKIANTNATSTPTLNVNAKGAVTILKQGTSAISPGDLLLGQIVEVEYDGTNLQLLTPVATTQPVGSMMMYAGASAPAGYLFCDGTSYIRTGIYAALFAVVSTTYGSADGSHFNVPDMRGRVPIGVGTGTGGGASGTGLPTGGSALTAVPVAGWKGEETHVLTTPEIPAHTHPMGIHSSGNGGSGTGTVRNDGSDSTGSTGGDGAHNNIQPVLGVGFIIRY